MKPTKRLKANKVSAWAVLNENGSLNCICYDKGQAVYERNRLKRAFKHNYSIVQLVPITLPRKE